MKRYSILLFACVMLLFSVSSFAQTEDDVIMPNPPEIENQERNTTTPNETDASEIPDSLNNALSKKKLLNFKEDHRKAAFYSAILPGLGQVYNNQYGKAPVYPAGILISLLNGIRLQNDYKNLKLTIQQEDNALNRARLRMDLNRKRNLANTSYALSVASYGFGIIDALLSNKIKKLDTKRHSPLFASYRSALIPGLGQIYNKQAWKVPIVYAAFVGTGFAIAYNLQNKNCFKTLYLNKVTYNVHDTISAQLATCLSTEQKAFLAQSGYTEADFLQQKQYFDRNLQWSVIAFVGVYILNLVDATVYGHLFDFKTIEEDLEISIKPRIDYTIANQFTTSLSLKIKL